MTHKNKSLVGWIEKHGKLHFEFSWNTLLISAFYKTRKEDTKKVRITIVEIK